MGFMNSAGVILPIELCGRSLLYSWRYASHFSLASSTDKNQFWSMHSARTFPLNTSAKGVIHGLPRSAEVRNNTIQISPEIKVLGDELRPLIDTDRSRTTVFPCQVL